MSAVARIIDVKKMFHVGIQDIEVLKGITFDVDDGDFLIILGPSGCGKSTLLHTILGLEGPTSGTVEMLNDNLYLNHDEDYRSVFRKKHIGMIYQQPNWVKSLTVVENVAIPLSLLGMRKDLALVKAWDMLTTVGMKNWANHIPTELSSGQQQKIALARSIVTDPQMIIADEPTGNLDYVSGQDLMKLMVDLNNKGKTIMMVTHDLEYLPYCKTAVRLLDGKVEGIYRGEEKKNLQETVKLKRVIKDSDEKVSEGSPPAEGSSEVSDPAVNTIKESEKAVEKEVEDKVEKEPEKEPEKVIEVKEKVEKVIEEKKPVQNKVRSIYFKQSKVKGSPSIEKKEEIKVENAG